MVKKLIDYSVFCLGFKIFKSVLKRRIRPGLVVFSVEVKTNLDNQGTCFVTSERRPFSFQRFVDTVIL